MTVRNESATALLKERQQSLEKKKNAADLNQLRKSNLRLWIVMIIAMASGLLYLGMRNNRKSEPETEAEKTTPVTTPIPFKSEELLGPNEHTVRDFFIEWRQRVTIDIFAECQNCFDESLYIYVLDEDNYRKFEGGEFYDSIGYVVVHSSYIFSDHLDRGRYYAILQNTSSQELVVNVIRADLSFKKNKPSN
jgi:hypothetical protein